MKIDMVGVKEDGKIKFVCGYNAAYATAQDLHDGHSSNGYSLEVFSSREEAENWYRENYPDISLRYCGEREIKHSPFQKLQKIENLLQNSLYVNENDLVSQALDKVKELRFDIMKGVDIDIYIPPDIDITKIRRRVEDALRKNTNVKTLVQVALKLDVKIK